MLLNQIKISKYNKCILTSCNCLKLNNNPEIISSNYREESFLPWYSAKIQSWDTAWTLQVLLKVKSYQNVKR